MARVCIIGLDSLAPALVFGALRGRLPHLERLVSEGFGGPMDSCLPPITVPAWACMFTGRDPGELGLYGFHDRTDRGYTNRRLASSLSFTHPTLWQLAGRAGKRVRVLGVPQTYPPKPVRGFLVAGMPTPPDAEVITYPEDLRAELDALCGGWRDDLPDFRLRPHAELLRELNALAEQHFSVARDWARRDDWELLVFVTVVPDRVHHVFWADPPPAEVVDFYLRLDAHVGALVAEFDATDVVMAVSDHGAQTNRGYFALNDWLRQRGDLALLAEPVGVTAFTPDLVDWSRTRAWADGGYVGRIYVNQHGREPKGLVKPDEATRYLADLAGELERVPGPDGAAWHNRAASPRELYAAQNGIPPDLFVLFDDLGIRPLGSVGHAALYPRDNDRGPDAANHAPQGICILRDGAGARPAPADLSLFDVVPTALGYLGVDPPSGLVGQSRARSG